MIPPATSIPRALICGFATFASFAVQRFWFVITRSPDHRITRSQAPSPLPASSQVGVDLRDRHPKSSQIGVYFRSQTAIGVGFSASRRAIRTRRLWQNLPQSVLISVLSVHQW
jgi:hypothetical protein